MPYLSSIIAQAALVDLFGREPVFSVTQIIASNKNCSFELHFTTTVKTVKEDLSCPIQTASNALPFTQHNPLPHMSFHLHPSPKNTNILLMNVNLSNNIR